MPTPAAVPDLVVPTESDQQRIIWLTDFLTEFLKDFPPVITTSSLTNFVVQSFVASPPESRPTALADVRLLVTLLEAVGDSVAPQAWERVRAVLPANSFNHDRPAGQTVQ